MSDAKDSKGTPLKIGDQVVVRGRIVRIPVGPIPLADTPALLEIEWESGAPLLNFVKSTSVTRDDEREALAGVLA